VAKPSFEHEQTASREVSVMVGKSQSHAPAEGMDRSRLVRSVLRDPCARSHHDENDSNIVLANQRTSGMPVALVGILASHFGIDGRQIEDGSSMNRLWFAHS
jgi:hypothetical protein